MQIKKKRVIETREIAFPALTAELHEVELDGKTTAYVVCFVNAKAGVALYNEGMYFVCAHNAAQYFELFVIYSDLEREPTVEQEKEYNTFNLRSRQEMEAYLNG